MGIEINKSGMSIKNLEEKFGFAPQKITTAESSDNFVYKEPEFKVEDGQLMGGDFAAFERLQLLKQNQALAQESQVPQEAFVNSSAAAPEMC